MLTPTEMEGLLENLDRRLDRIERILPTLATKEDLRLHAAETTAELRRQPAGTTAELRRQAAGTTAELRRRAAETTEELRRRAAETKEELRRQAAETKEELHRHATEARDVFATKADLLEAFERAERTARVLHEDLVERIKLLGEHRRKRR